MTNKGLQITLSLTAVFEAKTSFLALLACGIDSPRSHPEEREHIVLPLQYDEREYHFRDPKRVPKVDPLGYADRYRLNTKSTNTYIAREMKSSSQLVWDYSARFSLVSDNLDLKGGIMECYPEVWTPALKQGRLARVFLDHPLRDTILFLHSGGGLPRFIAKVKPRGSWRLVDLSCVVAWMPGGDPPMSLAELILEGLEVSEMEETHRRWYDALDDVVEWQTDLVTDDGSHLSVRVGEDSTGKLVIKFETGRSKLEATDPLTTRTSSQRKPKTRKGRRSGPRHKTPRASRG
jgi:hypothetical protein